MMPPHDRVVSKKHSEGLYATNTEAPYATNDSTLTRSVMRASDRLSRDQGWRPIKSIQDRLKPEIAVR
jgi:hypothetical protein